MELYKEAPEFCPKCGGVTSLLGSLPDSGEDHEYECHSFIEGVGDSVLAFGEFHQSSKCRLRARIRELESEKADLVISNSGYQKEFRRLVDQVAELEGQLHYCPTCKAHCKECLCVEERLDTLASIEHQINLVLGKARDPKDGLVFTNYYIPHARFQGPDLLRVEMDVNFEEQKDGTAP